MGSVTLRYEDKDVARVRDLLIERGFALKDAPYAHFTAKSAGCNVTFYNSGKVLIQGKAAAEFADVLSPQNVLPEGATRFDAALEMLPGGGSDVDAWIGSDESGKGDYFGALVTVAVRVERDQLPLLEMLGAADCKQLSDAQVRKAARDLRTAVQYAQILIGPKKYNTLYKKSGSNLNRLLAWSHARAIENLLEEHPDTKVAVIDRFCKRHRIDEALMERGKELEIVLRPRAEDDPAVAVASILARDAFLSNLGRLSQRFGVKLAKGAGPPVLVAGKRFVAKHGREALEEVGKLHFKTTQQF